MYLSVIIRLYTYMQDTQYDMGSVFPNSSYSSSATLIIVNLKVKTTVYHR